MSSFKDRILKAAMLDASIYEEVEADTGATLQSLLVVVLSSVAAGIGNIAYFGYSGIIWASVSALISWFVWAFIVYFIGAKFIPEPQTQANLEQPLRTIGFASAPGLIRVGGIITGLAGILAVIAGIWMLIAMVIAVRQALDYKSTLRAVIVCVVGAVAYGLISALVIAFFGQA